MNLSIALFSLVPFIGVPPPQTPEDLAEKGALAWLALTDSGSYEESWKEAASLFRGAVSSEDWGKAMTGARKPLGRVLSRKVKSRTYRESLPALPTESTWSSSSTRRSRTRRPRSRP